MTNFSYISRSHRKQFQIFLLYNIHKNKELRRKLEYQNLKFRFRPHNHK